MEMANHNDTLQWDVITQPLYTTVGDQTIPVPGKVAQIRDDSMEVIGVTGTGYNVFQNSQLREMIDPLLEEGLLEIENIGVIRNGARVFIQAKMSENFIVAGEETKGMISLLNAHDGTASLAAGVTTERIICNNTFASAMTDMDSRLRHGKDIHEKAADISAILSFVNEGVKRYQQAVEALCSHRLVGSELDDIIAGAYGKPADSVRAANNIRNFAHIGKGNDGTTLWSAVNGVTEYLTHHSSKDASKRFLSNNYGRNAVIARRAMKTALSLV